MWSLPHGDGCNEVLIVVWEFLKRKLVIKWVDLDKVEKKIAYLFWILSERKKHNLESFLLDCHVAHISLVPPSPSLVTFIFKIKKMVYCSCRPSLTLLRENPHYLKSCFHSTSLLITDGEAKRKIVAMCHLSELLDSRFSRKNSGSVGFIFLLD